MSDIKVQDVDFEPKRRGRRPVVNIQPLIDAADANEGQWVSQELSEREAGSVLRQIKEYEGIDVASSKSGEDRRIVYIRAYS